MDLPPEVAQHIGQLGVEMPDGTVAWTATEARTLLGHLCGSKVAVLEGELFKVEPIGPVPLYQGWSCTRAPGETATDYARRSQELAQAEIDRCEDEDALFAFRFSDQRDAA